MDIGLESIGRSRIIRSIGLAASAAVLVSLTAAAAGQTQRELELDQPQTAGISGFRVLWNEPIVLSAEVEPPTIKTYPFGPGPQASWMPQARVQTAGRGALVFDAVHRQMLVRFPEAAKRIADRLRQGAAIDKVHIILPYRDVELLPPDYTPPAGGSFIGSKWADNPPRWHAVAWALRKPWHADAETGPTYNAYFNGTGYWEKYGAADETHDRYPQQFGPTEVSHEQPEGQLDVTAMLTGEAFGATPGQRLRRFAERGVIVRKWETYDVALWKGSYEWTTATGGRGILIDKPKLIVTFKPGPRQDVSLPPATDFGDLAQQLERSGEGGKPTAVMPDPQAFEQLEARFGYQQPPWMPDWQWERVAQLIDLGGDQPFPQTYEEYEKWVDDQLGILPRRWAGFNAVEWAQNYLLYSPAMPEPLRDHWKQYWRAWLMPERDREDLVHGYVGGKAAQEYYQRTRDWRGNFSVYRTYTHDMGTMNFNHWAVAGVLLGGAILEDEQLIREGRHGLNHLLLRLWSWYDGSTQESIDHYYFAHSLTAQKLFADLGPKRIDRMMGQMMIAKSLEELTSAFHPGLRRFISPSQRTSMTYVFGLQDGLSYILHTLSQDGTLTDLEAGREWLKSGKPTDTPLPSDVPPLGYQYPPGAVAQQTLNGPWGPPWIHHMLNDKPLPYRSTVTFKKWGQFRKTPLFRRSYQGHNYGLASVDIAQEATVPVMAQWRREDKLAQSMTDLATLTVRFGINQTEFLDTKHIRYNDEGKRVGQNPNGTIGTHGGYPITVQHDNTMLIFASPLKGVPYRSYYGPRRKDPIRSLQTSIALFDFQPGGPTWRLYRNGEPIDQLPARAEAGDRLTIHDGVTYLGIIPMPSTDLGRDAEIVITDQTGDPVELEGRSMLKPTLVIHQYLYRRDEPLTEQQRQSEQVDHAHGGFVIEVADRHDFEDFAAFERHLQDASLEASPVDDGPQVDVTYTTGDRRIDVRFDPSYNNQNNVSLAFPRREVNGEPMYLPKGLDRDTTLTQQGSRGRLVKNGATLLTEPGRMAYLQTEPTTRSYAAYNPFPDLNLMRLETPGGAVIQSDARMGLTRVIYQPDSRRLNIEHAVLPEHANRQDLATAIVVSGITDAPEAIVNERAVEPIRAEHAGDPIWIVPLTTAEEKQLTRTPEAVRQILERAARMGEALGALAADEPDVTGTFVSDWAIAGPLPYNDRFDFAHEFGPETEPFNPRWQTQGAHGKRVGWEAIHNRGEQVKFFWRWKPNTNVSAYATTKILSDKQREVTFLVGSNDGVRMWLNGELIWSNDSRRGAKRDQDVVHATLKPGENRVLLKVAQHDGGWGFYFRIADPMRLPIPRGVRVVPDKIEP